RLQARAHRVPRLCGQRNPGPHVGSRCDARHRSLPGDHRVLSHEPTDRPPDARGVIVVANAPVSYGAFELTVGIDPNVPDGVQVLDEVAAAGYGGIDLGPVGYLGNG